MGLVVISQGVAAVDSDLWVKVTSSDKGVFYVKKGTFHNAHGSSSVLIQEVVSPLPLVNSNRDVSVNHYRVSVKNKVCDDGYGEASYFFLSGELAFHADYVSGGGSVGDSLGDFICSLSQAKSPSSRK